MVECSVVPILCSITTALCAAIIGRTWSRWPTQDAIRLLFAHALLAAFIVLVSGTLISEPVLLCIMVYSISLIMYSSFLQKTKFDELSDDTAVSQSYEQYRKLFSKGEVVVFKWSADWDRSTHNVSDSIHSLTGFSKEDFVYRRVEYSELIHPEDVQKVRTAYRESIQSNTTVVSLDPYRIRCRDGHYIWVHERTQLARAGGDGPRHYIGYLVNVSELMNAQLHLNMLSHRILQVFHGAEIGVWDLKAKKNEVKLSRVIQQLLKTSKTSMSSRDWKLLVHPEDSAAVSASRRTLRSSSASRYVSRHRIRRTDNEYIWVLEIGHKAVGSDADYSGVYIELTDEIENETELIRQRQEAEEIARTKSRFLSMISHELRTPLNSIVGLTQLLLEEELLKPTKFKLQTIQKSSKNLLQLIERLLLLSNSQNSAEDVHLEVVSLPDILQSVFEVVSHQLTQKRVRLELHTSLRCPSQFRTDAFRVQQILQNVIHNAIKFTPSDSVVKIMIKPTRRTLRIRIQDEGFGVSHSEALRIFEPFLQGSCTSSTPGTGLGLSICRQLTSDLSGKLTVLFTKDSATSSCFQLHLPLHEEDRHGLPDEKDLLDMQNYDVIKKLFQPKATHPITKFAIPRSIRGMLLLAVESGDMRLVKNYAEKQLQSSDKNIAEFANALYPLANEYRIDDLIECLKDDEMTAASE